MLPSLLIAAALSFTSADAHVALETARELTERHTPRDAGTGRGRDAAAFLFKAATAAGVTVRRDVFRASTPRGERAFINLYGELGSGEPADDWVVILSHFDTKTGVNCPGANDGASTSGLLVGLAGAWKRGVTPKPNLLLVWPDGEECLVSYGESDGLWGSRRAAEWVRFRGLRVRAVICADMLGDRDLSITVPSNGSPALARLAEHAARRAGCPGLVRRIDGGVTDDHVPFLKAGYPAVDLIDFEYGPNNAYWHTAQDTMDKIAEESLLKSGKVITELINLLL